MKNVENHQHGVYPQWLDIVGKDPDLWSMCTGLFGQPRIPNAVSWFETPRSKRRPIVLRWSSHALDDGSEPLPECCDTWAPCHTACHLVTAWWTADFGEGGVVVFRITTCLEMSMDVGHINNELLYRIFVYHGGSCVFICYNLQELQTPY